MSSQPEYPFYVGASPPSGYVNLGGNLHILPSDSTGKVFSKQISSLQQDGFTKLDDRSSYGVSDKLILKIDSSNQEELNKYVIPYRDDFLTYKYPAGRLLRDGRFSSVLFFDRTGLNNDLELEQEVLRVPGKSKYLNLGTSDKNWLFLILSDLSSQLCCRNSSLGDECGFGSKALISSNPVCVQRAKEICTSSNPRSFFGQFCQRDYCKTDPNSVKTGECDQHYKTLCNIKQDLSVSPEEYPWYNKYPDYCSCFMNRDFLVPMCNTYISQLGITRNIKAQNALGLNVNDPNQCKDSCKVHPLCKPGAQVPYQMNRGDNPVILGANFPSECSDVNLCVQDVTVNQSGNNIGKLTVNQEGNCKTTLQKVCAFSTYSPCTGASVTTTGTTKTYTYKKYLLEDRDQGACADPETAFTCAQFNISNADYKTITCDTNKEKIGFNLYNSYTDGFEPEVLAAANDLINNIGALESIPTAKVTSFKDARLSFNPVSSSVDGELDCKNCVVDYEYTPTCSLESSTKRWKQNKKFTKIVSPAIRGGAACKTNSTIIKDDCSLNNDCLVAPPATNPTDKTCTNGEFKYYFNIKSFNSGEGKACSDSVLDALPENVKASNPRVDIDYTNFKGIATVNCNDCVVDYVADENTPEGKCHIKSDGSYVITKYAKVIKQATAGGNCPATEMKKVTDKLSVEVPCTNNQDCVFNTDPISDDCDDTVGIRTIKYSRDTLETGNGRKCEDVGYNLARENSPLLEYNYDPVKKVSTVKTSCDISTDCLVQLYSSKCDSTTGIKKDVYSILLDSKARGKTCEDTVREITGGSVTRSGMSITSEESCEKVTTGDDSERIADKKKYITISIIVFILIVMFSIFLL
jgi:hypothetical protein